MSIAFKERSRWHDEPFSGVGVGAVSAYLIGTYRRRMLFVEFVADERVESVRRFRDGRALRGGFPLNPVRTER